MDTNNPYAPPNTGIEPSRVEVRNSMVPNGEEQPALWLILGILLLFLAFGMLPFVPEINLFMIVWMFLFAVAGISSLYYGCQHFGYQQRPISKRHDLSEGSLPYEIAYRIVPEYIFSDIAHSAVMLDDCMSNAQFAEFLYCGLCDLRGFVPSQESRNQYKTTLGKLDAEIRYVLLHFPKQKESEKEIFILSPYFSCILYQESTNLLEYYVLGNAPILPGESSKRERTTFRMVTKDGKNVNLGPGPSATASDFLERICAFRKTVQTDSI